GETVAAQGAAMLEDKLPRPSHVRGLWIVPGQFEREVVLDRNAHFHRPARVETPAALGALLREDIVGGFADALFVLAAKERHQQNVFGFENGVALELGAPVAIGLLFGDKTAAGPLHRAG